MSRNKGFIKFSALITVFLFAVLFAFPYKAPFNALAGASKVYVLSSASVRGSEINQGDIKIEGGVYASNNKIVFDEALSKTARILAKTRVNDLKEYGVLELFEASATFEFEKLADGGSASFVFGLKKFSDDAGSVGSGEVVFTYDKTQNSICVEVNEYLTKNVATHFAVKTAYSMLALNTAITLRMNVDVNGKAVISVESADSGVKPVYIVNGKTLDIAADGFIAFRSVSPEDNAKNIFRLYDVSVTAFAYDLVETVDHYIETFDKNSYNANMFYSESVGSPITPSKIAVENGRLTFRNVGQGYFTTREQYSNFELKFDIVDLYRKGVKDENGNIEKLISHWFMIGFGVDNYNDPPSERIQATFLHFEGLPGDSESNRSNHFTGVVDSGVKDRYILWNNAGAVSGSIKSMSGDKSKGIFSLWDDEYIGNLTVNLKLRVVDGVIELYYKLESQTEYVLQYRYDLGTMQTGYVRIYSYGAGAGSSVSEYTSVLNMTIDNFEITNLDNDAVKLVKPSPVYKSNIMPKTKDYDYDTVTDDSDLLNYKLKK